MKLRPRILSGYLVLAAFMIVVSATGFITSNALML